ncbi:CHRNN [Mytilus edulis]|uniref:CHRNN n=1 Tax=Mytilus edulis TaxID=6550 RepID=A0A8S3R6D5_MYTED|nr:CHRNN [Mytilus edulis]
MSYDFSDEGKLRTTLFKDYVSKALPTVRSSKPVHTKVQLNLHSIYDLDIKKQKLSSTVHIFVTWKDDALKWNETLYNEINMVLLSLSEIWKPDIVLINSMEAKIIFQSNDEVLLDSKGTITWNAYLNLDTFCPIDTTLYPFDTQTCNLVFSKLYTSDRYNNICHDDSNNIIQSYVSNGEWDIVDIRRLYNTRLFPLGNFTEIIFRIIMERKSEYYYWTYVMPMLSLAVVNVAAFCLPVKSQEKLNICLFVFLSMVYLVTVVNESMPHTSDNRSKFGKLMWWNILFSGLIIITNIIIITMVHRKSPKFIPPLTRKISRKIYNCLCCKSDKEANKCSQSSSRKTTETEDKKLTNSSVVYVTEMNMMKVKHTSFDKEHLNNFEETSFITQGLPADNYSVRQSPELQKNGNDISEDTGAYITLLINVTKLEFQLYHFTNVHDNTMNQLSNIQ